MKNGQCWLDDSGKLIQAHGGMIARFGEKWYWFDNDGSMASSRWIFGKDRKWYYVGSDGVMLTNTRTPDGYYVDANGVWVQ